MFIKTIKLIMVSVVLATTTYTAALKNQQDIDQVGKEVRKIIVNKSLDENTRIQQIIEKYKELFKSKNINTDGIKLIHIAAIFGFKDIIIDMIKMGISIKTKSDTGAMAIHYVTYTGKIEIVKWLLEHGATIHDTTTDGLQPIHFAAAGGHIPMVKFLLNNGATINDKTSNYLKPIHYALEIVDIPMVKFLVENGSDFGMAAGYIALNIIDTNKKKIIFDEYLCQGMIQFFADNDDTCRTIISEKLKVDGQEKKKEAMKKLITWASYRDHRMVERLYEMINILFDENEQKAFGFNYTTVKELYVAAANSAPSSLKRKEWVKWLLTLCKGDIFTSEPTSFEFEVKELINKKLEPEDKNEIKQLYKKNYGQTMFSFIAQNKNYGPNFVDLGINFK